MHYVFKHLMFFITYKIIIFSFIKVLFNKQYLQFTQKFTFIPHPRHMDQYYSISILTIVTAEHP